MNNENLTEDINNDILREIKKEDKKHVKKYTIFMIICTVFGGFLGFTSVRIISNGGNLEASDFSKFLSDAVIMFSPYVMLFVSIVSVIFMAIFYQKSRSLYNSWDGEDDGVINNIEKKLSIGMAILNCSLIIYYIMLAVYIGGLFKVVTSDIINFDNEGVNADIIFIVRFAVFLISFVLFMIALNGFQKKFVNFEKEINPEKRGSVYDMHFQKKWEESCDEAEKLCIYKSAWLAYKAVNITCLILLVLCTIGMVIFDFGIASVFVIGIIWLVSSLTYMINTVKLSSM